MKEEFDDFRYYKSLLKTNEAISQKSRTVIINSSCNLGELYIAQYMYGFYMPYYNADYLANKAKILPVSERNYLFHILKLFRNYGEQIDYNFENFPEEVHITDIERNIIRPALPYGRHTMNSFLDTYNFSKFTFDDFIRHLSLIIIYDLYEAQEDFEYKQERIDLLEDILDKNDIENVQVIIKDIRREVDSLIIKLGLEKDYEIDNTYKEPVSNGYFILSWSNIRFISGYMYMYHPLHPKDNPFRLEKKESISAFNELISYFSGRLPKIIAKAKDGIIIDILNPEDIDLGIEKLIDKYRRNNGIKTHNIKHDLSKMNDSELREHLKQSKSKYLNWLCQQQLSNYKIYYVREIKTNSDLIDNDEDAFIFTIKETKQNVTLVYENSNEDRSTIVFRVPKVSVKDRINQVHQYFSSTLVNKRELLVKGKADDPIFKYNPHERILHTTFGQWSNAITRFSNNLPIHNYYEW